MGVPYYDEAPWGADCPVSMPEPFDDEVPVDFGGFGFTAMGLVINMTTVDREVVLSQQYAPKDVGSG